MSNEIMLGKSSANGTVDVESPIVVGKKIENGKKKRQGSLLLLFLMAVGLGAAAAAVALTSITLPAPVALYGRVDSPDSIDDSGSSGSDGAAAAGIPAALADSATATDGKGTVIEANGLTKSGEMTMTGYSGSSYSAELRCSIDSLPVHCSGSPLTLSGLPPGDHVLTMTEPLHDKITVKSFSWEISE
jgi:hypothetical protein